MTPEQRVLIDTDVLLSFIVGPSGAESPIEQLVISAFKGDFVLLVPVELIRELASVLKERPYFTQRISPERPAAFMSALIEGGEAMEPLPVHLPPLSVMFATTI